MTIKLTSINANTRDGWERTFGKGIPEMNDDVKAMLNGWVKKEPHRIMLFFLGKCDYSEEYSGFLMREFMRGNV